MFSKTVTFKNKDKIFSESKFKKIGFQKKEECHNFQKKKHFKIKS